MEIEKHIKKLVNPLKDEDELLQSLKIKLTIFTPPPMGAYHFFLCMASYQFPSIS